MSYLHMDYETRSEVELAGADSVGLHNYAIHPSTKVLMLAWAIGQDEPQIWFPEDPMPQVLEDAIHNPLMEIAAHNSTFERYITKYVLNIDIPASRFQDTQPSARYLSLPSSLEDVGKVLGLPTELRKDKRGVALIDLFSCPKTHTKKQGGGTYFNDKNTHPKEWEEFCAYALQDVRAEREIARRLGLLGAYPLPKREREIWLFDQKVNDRGIPTDVDFVRKAFKLAERAKEEKLSEQNTATGLENANSTSQLLPWVQDRGYPLNNLRKQNIEIVLKDKTIDMAQECRDVLTARMEASSTSYKKLQAILRNVSPDGRLRNQFIYMGSSRCGRWSGNNVQLHNLSRPGVLKEQDFEDKKVLEEARAMVYKEDYEGLKNKYGSVLLAIKFLIRTVFVA